MNRILRMACVAVAVLPLLWSCAKKMESSYEQMESEALAQWIGREHPDLVDNFQPDGDYYVDVLSLGDTDAKSISEVGEQWVRFTFTGRNLSGDVVLTRSEIESNQVDTYTKFTRYVPFYRYYAGDSNGGLLEGTYLAIRNTLTLGEAYAAQKGYPRQVQMRYGTKVKLYLPSTVVGVGGLSGSGGYEGQQGYQLRGGCPLVVTMEITDTVKSPLKRETEAVNTFAKDNGRLKPLRPKMSAPETRDMINPNDPYNDGFSWRHANEEIPEVYMNLIYSPTTRFAYGATYPSIYQPYNDFNALEQAICDTLVNRFGAYAGPKSLPKDSVKINQTAKIWYIGRFLDGFIFDSNIPGVRQLVYGEKSHKATPLSYKPDDDSQTKSWQYAVPNLLYGQWAAILTTSTNAYGATGVAGKTNVTSEGGETNYNDYMNYLNYANGMYGAGGYGYLNDYYGNFMGGRFDTYIPNTSTVTTSTSIATEIPPFTPVLYQIYIEPKAK